MRSSSNSAVQFGRRSNESKGTVLIDSFHGPPAPNWAGVPGVAHLSAMAQIDEWLTVGGLAIRMPYNVPDV